MSIMQSVFAPPPTTTIYTDAQRAWAPIYWYDYPLDVSMYNLYLDTDWTITNPDSSTLRVAYTNPGVGGVHAWNNGAVSGLGLFLKTPISAMVPPGISGWGQFRTVSGIRIEWSWAGNEANLESAGPGCGYINDDGLGGTLTNATSRGERHAFITNGSGGTQCTVKDHSQGNNYTITTTADPALVSMIGVFSGNGIRSTALSYSDSAYTFNRKESNFPTSNNNRGSGFLNSGDTWDAVADGGVASDYYFFVTGVATGTSVAAPAYWDIKKVSIFVHSLGAWTK